MERYSEQKNTENKGRTRSDEKNASSNRNDNNGSRSDDKNSKDSNKRTR